MDSESIGSSEDVMKETIKETSQTEDTAENALVDTCEQHVNSTTIVRTESDNGSTPASICESATVDDTYIFSVSSNKKECLAASKACNTSTKKQWAITRTMSKKAAEPMEVTTLTKIVDKAHKESNTSQTNQATVIVATESQSTDTDRLSCKNKDEIASSTQVLLDINSNSSENTNQPSTSKSQNDQTRTKTNENNNSEEVPQTSKRSMSECPREPELMKHRKVDIYMEDSSPKWYNIQGNRVTRPILAKKLPEVYDFLPIFGAPNSKNGLKDFQDNKIREFVGGLNDEEFKKLAQYCSSDHLRTGEELKMLTNIPCHGLLPKDMEDISNNTDDLAASNHGKDSLSKNELCIVRKCKMRMDRDTSNTYAKRLKYRGIRLIPLCADDDNKGGELLEPGKDVLIRVRIYRPFPYNVKDRPTRCRPSIFSRDMYLLGRQTLEDLRERFVCSNDVDMRVDASDRMHCVPITCAKDLFPSGFMFINNKFYVDSRPGCTDHSERIRRWAASRNLGVFPKADMAGVKLEDVPIKLGHPEVYVHQGNCEHLFTFSEVRLLGASDPLRVSSYPCHTAVSQNQTVYCTTCAEFGAKWIVVGCAKVPFDPAFFCDTCLKLYLYKDGKKIGDFKAYYYRGNEINILKPQG